MPLPAAKRNKLPPSAFAYPAQRKYPVPTKAQARKAGIGERERVALHRAALSRAGQKRTSGSYSTVARKVGARGPVTPRGGKARKR